MRAQLKVVLLVAVVLVATISAIVWKTQGLLLEDKLRFINDSSLKQVAPLKRLVSEKIENEKLDLVRFATTREAQGAGHSSAFGGFDVIALLEPAPSTQTANWAPTWIEKGPNAHQEKWPAGYDVTLLKSLPYSKVKDGTALWVRLSDSQGAPVYAVLVSVEVQSLQAAPAPTPDPAAGGTRGASLPDSQTEGSTAPSGETAVPAPTGLRRAVVVGFASQNPLASITEDYIGSINVVYILDDRGYVASHVDKAYLGSLFSEDSLAKEIMKGQKLSDTGEFEDMEGRKVIGHFEKVENTNLTAVITTPIGAATEVVDASLRNSILVGGSVGFVGLVLAWLVGGTLHSGFAARAPNMRRSGESPESSKSDMPDLGDVTTPSRGPSEAASSTDAGLATPTNFAEHVGSARLQDERKYAFQAFHASLAARLREPLLAVLGHVQLVKTKSTDEAILAHADSIEREARLAKDAIEHWQILEEAPGSIERSEKVDLEKVALAALADKVIELEGSGIEVVKETSAVPMIKGRAKDLETALGHMIENSIEAMRDQSRRKLTMKLTMVGSTIRLSLEDTGIGMTKDVKEKAFEPFFKGFQAPRHMGLGLAFVQSTLNRSTASVEIESTPGEGARFIMKFPVEAEMKRAFDAERAPPVIPSTAPPLPSVAPPPPPPTFSMAPLPPPAASVSPPPVLPPLPKKAPSLGGREPIAGNAVPGFPGVPMTPPLTGAPSAPAKASFILQPEREDDLDESDQFKSVSMGSTSEPHEEEAEKQEEEITHIGTPVAQAVVGTPPPVSPSGTEFQVKIRRPKPKGQT